ncbi:hypothetical protein KR059_009470, partial [Drosophila kikkawai]
MDSFRFGIVDYVVFLGTTILSIGIGVYYGWIKKTKRNTETCTPSAPSGIKSKRDLGSEKMNEYLMGSRNLKVLPVAMSLIASYISGVSILGTPSEIYNYGTQYCLIVIPIIVHGLIVSYVYLPVFSILQVGSSFEYLEMRFHSSIRSIASIIFVSNVALYLPFLVYLPALALNQVSGLDMYLIEVLIIVVCVIYTILGGLKAVVHTDVWQVLIMFISVVVVAILATCYIEDFEAFWQGLEQGGRLIIANISPSPYDRQTVWSVLIGGLFYWTSTNAISPTMVHRYMSLPSLNKARAAIGIFSVGSALFIIILCFLGVLIFHTFHDCDPLSAGMILDDDQLMPLFVIKVAGHIYGMPGLFIAGIFGAGLSSLSVYFNSTSLVILEDIVRGCFKMQPGERASTILVKSSILVLGVLAFALIFLLEQASGVLSIWTSVAAIASGATFGIFTLGMLVPWANTIGTAVGAIAGFLLSGWITFGMQITAAAGQLNSQKLPVSVQGCTGNVTLSESIWKDEDQVFPLYRLSYLWVTPIGVLTSIVVGSLVSLVTKPTDMKTVNPDLISPVIHRYKADFEFDTKRTDIVYPSHFRF